jgi:hypothetical protein
VSLNHPPTFPFRDLSLFPRSLESLSQPVHGGLSAIGAAFRPDRTYARRGKACFETYHVVPHEQPTMGGLLLLAPSFCVLVDDHDIVPRAVGDCGRDIANFGFQRGLRGDRNKSQIQCVVLVADPLDNPNRQSPRIESGGRAGGLVQRIGDDREQLFDPEIRVTHEVVQLSPVHRPGPDGAGASALQGSQPPSAVIPIRRRYHQPPAWGHQCARLPQEYRSGISGRK